MTTTTFISQLPQVTQDEIRKDILAFYESEQINPLDTDDFGTTNIELAMGGRLCDLEDNINISKYL